MATVLKTNSDIQLDDGSEIVDIRVSGIGFTTASGNSVVHRPRAGTPQAVEGHVTGANVSVECYIFRSDFDAVARMTGRAVVVRFTSGGSLRGILTGASATAEPVSWMTENPYVEASLAINTVEQKVGLT